MTDFRLLTLSTLTSLEPAGPLPAWLVAANPSEDQIADLGWSGRTGQGYWPIIVADDPAFDSNTHRLSDPVEGKPSRKTSSITVNRKVIALTADELAVRNAARQADLLAYVGTARYAREMAGVAAPGGFRIATDDRSKLLLAGSRIKAEADPTYSTKWKVSPTDRVDVPASQIIAMSDAVLAFVDACFDADAAACAAILAGTITTRAEVDAFIAHALP